MNIASVHTQMQDEYWSVAKKLGFRFISFFVILFMLTLPYPHRHIPDLPALVAPFFERIAKWVGDDILQLKQPYTSTLISDSTGLYIHLLVLLVISLIAAIVWGFLDKKRKNYRVLLYWFRVVISYYLALFLLIYGFNKIFKWQFYLPEPNTLFTTMGNTYRDLLYWSTMGTSHSYNVFLGSVEILAALLLFFRKTRLLGALFAIGVMLNIVVINFSFDISVKIFSVLLLLLAVLIVVPDARRLYNFFIRNRAVPTSGWQPVYTTTQKKIYYILKPLVIAFLFWAVLSSYIRSGNYNDDKAPRPVFHGAYDIPIFILNGDTLPPLITDPKRWRRLFIHRRGYLIVQSMQDEMQDYSFEANTLARQWKIWHTETKDPALFKYEQPDDSTINLQGKAGSDSVKLQLKKIDLSKLPVMKKEFNWTID